MSHTQKNNLSIVLKTVFILFVMVASRLASYGQTDMLNSLDSGQVKTTEYVKASFKSTRVINVQSLENLSEGVLDFRIMHRFGPVNQGFYNLFGLDQANTRLQFDYGIKDWLQVGIGRSTVPKSYSGYVKWKFIRQSIGKIEMPISVIYHGYINTDVLRYDDPIRNKDFNSRLSFVNQIIVGRKFNDNFSLELVPTFIHYNLVPLSTDKNDRYALGVGFRQRLSRRTTINFEYFYLYPTIGFQDIFKNELSVGFDIETGGHVFQLHFTNTLAMTENTFITEHAESWLNGGIHLGFNISRVFTIYHPNN